MTNAELLAIVEPQIQAAMANPGLRSISLPDGSRYEFSSPRVLLELLERVKAAAAAEANGSDPTFHLAGLRGL